MGWTKKQHQIFDKLMAILSDALLGSRCASNADSGKASLRLHIDEAAKRLRGVFASVEWKTSLVQWLHTVMMEHAGYSSLAIYLDIIQVFVQS